jgi:hypothetical protein
MISQALAVVATAVLSSLLTLGLAAWYFRRQVRPRLEGEVEERVEQAAAVIQERVRQGVSEALSELRIEDMLPGPQRAAVKTATELLEAGLRPLMGAAGRRRREPR